MTTSDTSRSSPTAQARRGKLKPRVCSSKAQVNYKNVMKLGVGRSICDPASTIAVRGEGLQSLSRLRQIPLD